MKNLWYLPLIVLFFLLPACNCCTKKCKQPVVAQNNNTTCKETSQLALSENQPHKKCTAQT